MDSKFKGFVYQKIAYKDNDYIINILTSEGIISFKGRGINKINSKNYAACEFFNISEYVFYQKTEKTNKTLTSSEVIKTYRLPYIDIKVSTAFFLIYDLIKQVSEEINLFPEAILCFDLLENKEEVLNVICYFLKLLCKKMGYLPNLQGCVNCHNKKQLVSFDFELGGFVCSNCFNEIHYIKMSPSFLKEIYEFLKNDDFYKLAEGISLNLYKMYIDFINSNTGIYINSDFYKKFFY